ncbi:type IV toxin-antitoxin system AbiEi family antitoxin domain-containing protein [Nocardioides pelophilus]|uniref:type IV toxin-antitoxin system AbiEi family antitoxin domain-containing protein n=1 Tax=Nocardioides pelophilus TaxID=2172019 RepID=UPI00160009F7|nr:type IV toxin-antitoxin system AbiEi family antitoxin domain-containing protein [Nocardioides pelophilus]
MNTRAIAQMSAHHGLITRRQAVEAGMSPDQIDRLVRRGKWTVVRKGVYAETAYVESLGSVRDQRLLRDRAASMRIASPHILSHHSSAYPLDLDVLHERPDARTHVTRPGIVGSHQRHGVVHHRAPYDAEQVAERDGLRVFGPARTACDISRDQGYLAGRVAAESAMRSGTSKAELDSIAAGMKGWPHATVVRDVNASASSKTDSVGETLSAELVISLGFGVPSLQFGLTADGRTAWCDLRLGRHLFEFDGRVKYQRVDEGGFASTSPDEVVWFEKRRQDWICGFKTGMSRLDWDEAFTIVTGGPALERVQARLTREYLDTCQRFGTDISDLAAYLPRGERPRPRPRPRSLPRYAA